MQKFLEFLSLLPDKPGEEYQAKLLSLLEQAYGLGLAFFNDMLICSYSDEKFTELAELPPEKMLGLQLQSLVPNAGSESLFHCEDATSDSPKPSTPHRQVFTSSITSRKLDLELTPLWKGGELFGVLAILHCPFEGREIKETSLREMPLFKVLTEIESEPRLEKLFGSQAPHLVILLDDEGKLEYANAAVRKRLGIGAGVIAYSISEDGNFRQPEYASLVKDALVGREVYLPALEYVTDIHGALGYGNGIKLNLLISLIPVEEPVGRTGIVMQFTLQDELALTQPVAFMQRSESVAMLARGVAHEFNNIFAAIKGITSLLHSEVEAGGFADNYLGKMDGLVDRGVKLISDLTSYARSSEPKMEKTDVSEFFRNYAALVDFIVPKEVKLEFELMAEGQFDCDKNSLRQGLFNLVQNSLDALKDSPVKRIRIQVAEVGASSLPTGAFHFSTPAILCVTVADSGPGIPADLATKIFEPYFSSKDPQRSTGLGLNVSQQIFRRHGGVLLAERVGPLGGAQFSVYLPLRKQP